jgi:putative Mg2+ transporter-C (MgtC) family protein
MDTKIELIIVAQLTVAFILGSIIGLEREMHGNSAGIRTYAAVTLGAALFTLIGIHTTDITAAGRIVANIVTGIGFLGAGIIYKDNAKGLIHGLTTASSIWAAAAVGVAVAYNMYIIAISATIAIYFLLALHHFRWYIKLNKKWAGKHIPSSPEEGHEH